MEIRENKNLCIIAPICAKLDKFKTAQIAEKILKDDRNIAIDLAYVSDCSIDFIEKIKNISSNKKIGIFNIPSDIFVLFNIMNIDKNINLFVSELDYKENSRQIINRKFSLV